LQSEKGVRRGRGVAGERGEGLLGGDSKEGRGARKFNQSPITQQKPAQRNSGISETCSSLTEKKQRGEKKLRWEQNSPHGVWRASENGHFKWSFQKTQKAKWLLRETEGRKADVTKGNAIWLPGIKLKPEKPRARALNPPAFGRIDFGRDVSPARTYRRGGTNGWGEKELRQCFEKKHTIAEYLKKKAGEGTTCPLTHPGIINCH